MPRKKTDRRWIFEKTYSNKRDAAVSIGAESCWSLRYTNKSHEGVSKVYRCNKVKLRGEQCAASIKVLLNTDGTTVSLFRAEAMHTCTSIETKAGIRDDAYKRRFRI